MRDAPRHYRLGMELKATTYGVEGHVAVITLNRPHRRNAWTGRMHTEYRWCMAKADADPAIRAAVVTGAGDTFCVGADSDALVKHASAAGYDDGLRTELANPGYGVNPIFDHHFAWHFGLRIPVIAAINGACAGVGLVLACYADIRIVALQAKLTTAAPKLGIPAEYGLSWLLPKLVGLTRANDLLLTGRVFLGDEAERIGLVNSAVEADLVLPNAMNYARLLSEQVSPAAVQATKRQIALDLIRLDLGASIDEAEKLMNQLMSGAQYREGVSALREKRAPNFGQLSDG
jgi:enoyl-CoA hydratase/carnithine racemase